MLGDGKDTQWTRIGEVFGKKEIDAEQSSVDQSLRWVELLVMIVLLLVVGVRTLNSLQAFLLDSLLEQ